MELTSSIDGAFGQFELKIEVDGAIEKHLSDKTGSTDAFEELVEHLHGFAHFLLAVSFHQALRLHVREAQVDRATHEDTDYTELCAVTFNGTTVRYSATASLDINVSPVALSELLDEKIRVVRHNTMFYLANPDSIEAAEQAMAEAARTTLLNRVAQSFETVNGAGPLGGSSMFGRRHPRYGMSGWMDFAADLP